MSEKELSLLLYLLSTSLQLHPLFDK